MRERIVSQKRTKTDGAIRYAQKERRQDFLGVFWLSS
jgi:hypothetical protein